MAQGLNLTDKHRSYLIKAINTHVLDPLLNRTMFQPIALRGGLSGTKFS
jgi:hypothetical protein